ncbi:PREDICTED: LOW QUALITY PROTEIN: olfactory receptor 2D2-like, partial [Merops nubicus]
MWPYVNPWASLMAWKACLQLAAGSWLAGLLMSTVVITLFSKLQ